MELCQVLRDTLVSQEQRSLDLRYIELHDLKGQ